MSRLNNKNIIIGLCGNNHCYKATKVIASLIQQKANVKILMHSSVQEYIEPHVLQLAYNIDVFTNELSLAEDIALKPCELAVWADIILIIPANTQVVCKIAEQDSDDLLTIICSANTSKILVFPSNHAYEIPKAITDKLKVRDIVLTKPIIDSDLIIYEIIRSITVNSKILHKKILITTGTIQEAIDTKHYIAKHVIEIGHMLAKSATNMGADTTLIDSSAEKVINDNINYLEVSSIEDMVLNVMQEIKNSDIFIAAASISDYKVTKNDSVIATLPNIKFLAEIDKLSLTTYTVYVMNHCNNPVAESRKILTEHNVNMVIVFADTSTSNDKYECYIFTKDNHKFITKQDKSYLANNLILEIAAEYCTNNLSKMQTVEAMT